MATYRCKFCGKTDRNKSVIQNHSCPKRTSFLASSTNNDSDVFASTTFIESISDSSSSSDSSYSGGSGDFGGGGSSGDW